MHHAILKLLDIYVVNDCVILCNGIIIQLFTAADFHLLAVWISASVQPCVAATVAAPTRNECDVIWGVCKPKCQMAFFSIAENWYRDSGLPPKWQKKCPSTFGQSARYFLTYSKTDNEPLDGSILMAVPFPTWSVFEWRILTLTDLLSAATNSTSLLNSGWPILFMLLTVIFPTRKTPHKCQFESSREHICFIIIPTYCLDNGQ